MRNRATAFLSAVLLLLLSGCGEYVRSAAPRPGVSLAETHWKLVELKGRTVKSSPKGKRGPYFVLEDASGSVRGYGGCNTFFGSYTLKPGNRIRFSKLASTLMSCPAMDLERDFLNALELADSYAIEGNTLELQKARLGRLATFTAVDGE